jgi:hypothetical protein
MNSNEFPPTHDPELSHRLGRLAGDTPDAAAAFTRVHSKAVRVRRARVAAWSATTALMIGGVAAAGVGSNDRGSLRPADTSIETSTSDDTTSSSTATTVATTVGDSSTPTTTESTAPSSSAPSTAPETSDATSSSAVDSTEPTVPAPSGEGTFSGAGGSIVVATDGSSVMLVSFTPAAGYSADVRSSGGDKVEVRFESSASETRIKVTLSNGALVPDIREKTEGDDDRDGDDDQGSSSSTPTTDDDDDKKGDDDSKGRGRGSDDKDDDNDDRSGKGGGDGKGDDD